MSNLLHKWFPGLKQETKEEVATRKGHELNYTLLTEYSVEEQTMIIDTMVNGMRNHRLQQIKDTEEYLLRLKKDLVKLKQLSEERIIHKLEDHEESI